MFWGLNSFYFTEISDIDGLASRKAAIQISGFEWLKGYI